MRCVSAYNIVKKIYACYLTIYIYLSTMVICNRCKKDYANIYTLRQHTNQKKKCVAVDVVPHVLPIEEIRNTKC